MVKRKSSLQFKRTRGIPLPVVLVICGVSIILTILVLKKSLPSVTQSSQPNTIVVGEFDTTDVIVPARPIAAGEQLSNVPMLKIKYPRHQLIQGALQSLDGFQKARAKTSLPANIPLIPQNLTINDEALNQVIQRIPPGMRAMTVKVDATSSVEGWATSGSVVDVIMITKAATSVIAERVRILSTEHSTDKPSELAPSVSVPSTVTLLVTQEQCLAINTATQHGRLAFALRSQDDEHSWQEPHFKARYLEKNDALSGDKTNVAIAVVKEPKGDSHTFTLIDNQWRKVEKAESPDKILSQTNLE
jgi:Flp pilus assembly protein CpaB